ncbi:hypothetical protein TTHERM_00773540 (macronuclear) [Tetrahymena thermophila SB210]|uniref:Uncharacterized protein n=1 Tax=Tetrahymena thermophila (strain SB210) TaxID=312017 RepID=I7M600_TETTS|nr:hypothetical protein TTHERM_00773540 [Tetrahymena thermophila SB210]EAR83944.1 hypothetical protein TTHERM_00773540 [Tetrahymena thermophila SB210]|eukprot:XP_001031607.1 hypothetical protein TTHERM_00773540 [Tetrahymena thermophila SB210]
MQKAIKNSIVKQQREAKDLGSFRKQRLFQNICKKNLIEVENVYVEQSEGHQLYDAHLKKMKQAKPKTIEDIQKDRANPLGIDKKQINKANNLLHEIDKKEKQLSESFMIKQKFQQKIPVNMNGVNDNQFYYDSLEIRSLNEFMFFYEILKRIKADKQHEEQRALFKAKLQKIWELEALANNRTVQTNNSTIKDSNKNDSKLSRIQSANSQSNNSRLKLSMIEGSPKTFINSNNLKGFSPSESHKQENETPTSTSQKANQKKKTGRIGLTQRVEELKNRDSQIKFLSIKPSKDSNEVDTKNNSQKQKVDQKVGTDELQIPNSTKNVKSQKEFQGTSKFMTMKQADIQLVELLEKIRKTTKTSEKREKTQNLIVPGMKKGFNAQDINNVVDQAIERAGKTKNVVSMQSFTTLDQNNLKVPILNKMKRPTDYISREKDSFNFKTRNASDLIIGDNFDTEPKEQNKLFKVNQVKSLNVIKLTEGIKSNKNNSQQQLASAQDQNNIQKDRESFQLNVIHETEEHQLQVRQSNQLDFGKKRQFSPENQNQENLNSNQRRNSSKGLQQKIDYQIKITTENEQSDQKTLEVESNKQEVRMSDLIDLSYAQHTEKIDYLSNKIDKNSLEIMNIKKDSEFFSSNNDEDIKMNQFLMEEKENNEQPSNSLNTQQIPQRQKKYTLEHIDRDSQHYLTIQDENRHKHNINHSSPDLDQSLSPPKLTQIYKNKSQNSFTTLLVPNRDSLVLKGSSYREISMNFTKKEIDKFEIEKKIQQNLDNIHKQLRIQKKVNLPQKLQRRIRSKQRSAKEQQEKYPFKFSPSFISNWVDLRSKIEQRYDIPSKFHVHKILNDRIREIKHQKRISNSADNSFYIYEPEYNNYYL